MDAYSFNETSLISSFFQFLHIKNGTMLDIGGHIGSSVMSFAPLGWNIFTFEAQEDNYKELSLNTKRFSNVKCVKTLVSDINGSRKFYVSSKHWGIHSIKPFHETHTQSVNLHSITLSKFVVDNNIKHVDFLKIDVEGADYLVIKGFDFKKDSPTLVMCEFMDIRTIPYFDYSASDVVNYMKNLGYSCFVFEWSEIVGGYGEKGVIKQSTKFEKFYPYSKEHNPNWGNMLFIKKPLYWLFEVYTKNYIKKHIN